MTDCRGDSVRRVSEIPLGRDRLLRQLRLRTAGSRSRAVIDEQLEMSSDTRLRRRRPMSEEQLPL